MSTMMPDGNGSTEQEIAVAPADDSGGGDTVPWLPVVTIGNHKKARDLITKF